MIRAFVAGLALFVCGLLCLDPPARAWWQSIQQVSVGGPTGTVLTTPSGTAVLSGGSLTINSGATGGRSLTNVSHTTGKYYFEVAQNTLSGGVDTASSAISLAIAANGAALLYQNDGSYRDQNSNSIGTGIVYTTSGQRVDYAVDLTGQLIWARVNGGNWNGNISFDPFTGLGGADFSPVFSAGSTVFVRAGVDFDSGTAQQQTYNFGATAYVGTPPTGFGNWARMTDRDWSWLIGANDNKPRHQSVIPGAANDNTFEWRQAI